MMNTGEKIDYMIQCLKVGERMPNMSIDDTQEQLRFA